MTDSEIGCGWTTHRRTGALVSLTGALVLLVAVLVGGGPTAGRAEAAVVSGRVTNTAGGCLENANATAAANNPLWLNSCAAGAGQQWSRWSDGTLRVQNLCADTAAGATAAGTRVVLATCSTATSQRWTFYAAGYVQNQRSRLCLTPRDGRIAAKVAVTVAACANVAAQRWTVPALSSTPTTTAPTTTTPRPTTTSPRPTTTTPPAGQTRPVWDSDFTGAGFGHVEDLKWQLQGAPAPTLVDSPSTPGARAAQFTMPGGGTRTEIVPVTDDFTEGQDRYFGFSFVLPPDFPTQVDTWQLLTQWKNEGTGSPPLELTVRNGTFNLSGGYGHPAGPRTFSRPFAPVITGKRVDLVIHVHFSRDPNQGVVDVWRDGVQVLAGLKPPGGTLYPSTPAATSSLVSYWKMGIYRDSAITQPARYVIERARIGTTYAQVSG